MISNKLLSFFLNVRARTDSRVLIQSSYIKVDGCLKPFNDLSEVNEKIESIKPKVLSHIQDSFQLYFSYQLVLLFRVNISLQVSWPG